MNLDYSSLHEAIKDAAKMFKGLIDFIRQTFQDIVPYLTKMMKEYKPRKKVRYKPVLEIKPTKTILLSKKLNINHCRSNL